MDFFRRAWRGEVALWLSYWVLGVGGNMSFAVLLAALYGSVGEGALVWLWLIYLVSTAWFVFIFAAIWRAGRRYPGRRLWPLLARLGVLAGVVRMRMEFALLISGVQ